MFKSTLKKIAQKSGKPEDFEKYKEQRNLIVKMNKKAKFDFCRSIESRYIDNSKNIWMLNPCFQTVIKWGKNWF